MLDQAAGKDKPCQRRLQSGKHSGQRLGVPDSGAGLRDFLDSIGENTHVRSYRRRQAYARQEGRMDAF
jgi:hypothetical protein